MELTLNHILQLPTDYKLRIPIPFYFNRYQNAGLSIPLIALLHSDVKLTLQMEKLANLIINDPLTTYTASGRPKLSLELKYIYLEAEERRRFATSKHEYLIEQENYRNYRYTGTEFTANINLLQPVKDMFWFARPTINKVNKQYFNYTQSKFYRLPKNYDRYDETNPVTDKSRKIFALLYKKYPAVPYIPLYINGLLKQSPLPSESPITNSILKFNNGDKRFTEDSDLTSKTNFCRYNNIPVSGLHAHSFSLYPNEYQPSGSCNFSQFGTSTFIVNTVNGEYDLTIIARNYNFLRIMGGQAGLAFEL